MTQQDDRQWPSPKPKRDIRQQKKAIDVDMNPMVDLAFLLLTFFMLATTFSKPQVMELVMPVKTDTTDEEQTQSIKESQAVTLIIAENNELVWYQGITQPNVQRITMTERPLHQLLVSLHEQIPALVLLIKPQATSTYEQLVDVLDEIQKIGIERYAITELDENDQNILRQPPTVK